MTNSSINLFVNENNEEFMTGSYNGISIIYRNEDKYVNVSKLCNKVNKSFYDFKRGKKWQQIIQYWTENEGVGNFRPLYELHKNYRNAQGIYIHPDLIHFVAEWVSIEYAFKVKRIMDLINERNQIENKSLDDTIKQLQEENSKLKEQLKQSNETIIEKNVHIEEHSVRVDENRRMLYVVEIDEDTCKLVADIIKDLQI